MLCFSFPEIPKPFEHQSFPEEELGDAVMKDSSSLLSGDKDDDDDGADGATYEMTTSTKPQQRRLVGQPRCLSTESYSLLLLLGSTVFYSTMSCCLQLCTTRDGIPSTELVLLRAIFQGTLVVWAMVVVPNSTVMNETNGSNGGSKTIANDDKAIRSTQRIPPPLLIQRPFGNSASVQRLVVARGIVGGSGFLLYYYTMSVLPLGDATTLLSLAPVITVVAAGVFLGETIRPTHVLASAACLAGSVLLAQPGLVFGHHHSDEEEESNVRYPIKGYVTGILGSCCGSTILMLIRTAGKKGVHVLQLLFSWCLFGFVFSAGIGLLHPHGTRFVLPTTSRAWAHVGGVCVLGSAAHLLMNYAARYAPAGKASIVRSASILWSYGFEVGVFGQVPSKTTLAGVGMILVALASIALETQPAKAQREAHGTHDDEPQRVALGASAAAPQPAYGSILPANP